MDDMHPGIYLDSPQQAISQRDPPSEVLIGAWKVLGRNFFVAEKMENLVGFQAIFITTPRYLEISWRFFPILISFLNWIGNHHLEKICKMGGEFS